MTSRRSGRRDRSGIPDARRTAQCEKVSLDRWAKVDRVDGRRMRLGECETTGRQIQVVDNGAGDSLSELSSVQLPTTPSSISFHGLCIATTALSLCSLPSDSGSFLRSVSDTLRTIISPYLPTPALLLLTRQIRQLSHGVPGFGDLAPRYAEPSHSLRSSDPGQILHTAARQVQSSDSSQLVRGRRNSELLLRPYERSGRPNGFRLEPVCIAGVFVFLFPECFGRRTTDELFEQCRRTRFALA